MTGPLANYVRKPRATERAVAVAHRTTAMGHRAVTQSTRAVTQSVAAVADVLRSANRPAVFAEGLLPSRLKRWWWKAGDLAWNVIGMVGVLAAIVVFAFVAYTVIAIAIDALRG
jgi:hypothetical protein